MSIRRKTMWRERVCLGVTAFITSSIAAITSHAQLELIQDFEAGMGDFTFTQAGYGTGNAETTADPIAGDGNQVLTVHAGDVNTNNITVVTPIPTIPEGNTGTVFMRLAIDSSDTSINGTVAVSPLEEPTGWGSANVLFNPSTSGGFNARDGDNYVEVVATRSNLTWYKVWYVINTTNDTYTVYLQGGEFGSPTAVAEDFAFRKSVAGEDLLSLFIYLNSGGSDPADPNRDGMLYLDDLYLDTASANLVDPVPDAAPSPNFTLVQDFESGIGDTTFTQAAYGTGFAEVVSDPFPKGKIGNQVLSVNSGDVRTNNIAVVTPIPVIPDNSIGTVFLRFALDTSEAAVKGTMAISPLESPTGWGDANVLFNTNDTGTLSARDGGSYITVAESRTDLTWYKAWYVINTASDTYSIYLQGGDFTEPTLLVDSFAFRKDASGEDLMSLLFYYNSGNGTDADPGLNGTVYIDDIYVDTAAANLTDPWIENAYGQLSIGFVPRDEAPVLDGVKDNLYRQNYSVASVPPGQSGVDSLEDLSATFSALHTADGLYIWLDILDSELSVDSEGQPWHDEMIQLFIDGDRNAGGTFDGENDVAFSIIPAGDGTATFEASGFPAPPADADFSGLDMFYIENEGTGRTAELFIPWEALNIAPRGTWEIGIEFQLNDDDDGGTRDSWITMASMGGGNNNTDEYSTAQLWGNKRADIKMTTAAIVVDGTLDTGYDGLWYVCDRWTNPVSHPDGAARFKASYDADNLYLLLEVTDDAIMAGESEQPWHDDGLEIAFDGNNNKGGGFDGTDDVKLAFRLLDLEGGLEVISDAGFPSPPAGTDFSGMETAQTVTETGWNLEIKLPWSVIKFDPEAGMPFGLELNVADDDDGGNRDGILTWSSAAGVNNNTDEYATVWMFQPEATVVAETADAIVIDGEIDEAYFNSTWNAYTRRNLPVGNNISAVWVGLYDSDNFYAIVDVVDDEISVDSEQSWHDDGIEFFFDPSNDSSGAFDGTEDIKIVAVLQPGELSPQLIMEDSFPAPPAGTDFSGVEAAWAETDTGWRIELKVPFATLRISPHRGWEMAFEASISDDDGGGNRETILPWSSIGNTNFGTELYGTVLLGGEVQLPWTGYTVGDVVNSPWFGVFEVSENGWLNHGEMLWLYVGTVTSQSGMWIYSLYLDAWVWSSNETFPLIYNATTGSWVYYFNIPDTGVWVYDYSVGEWVLNQE